MDKKLRQVTDNIHDTIYLSQLESELISTPFFYRLHDIYQSSTVYMTFPSNRTKRYEHSVGTMEVASSMLFSAVSNADNETRSELFKRLKRYLKEIYELAFLQSEAQDAQYFMLCKEDINQVFEGMNNYSLEDVVKKDIKNALSDGYFNDSALDHFQYYPMGGNGIDELENVENVFLYRCLLQAVRIVALFHDVGHPPYSHIIEKVLVELYNKYSNIEGKTQWQQEQLKNFKMCLKQYISKESKDAYDCRTIYSRESLVTAEPHERIGLSLLLSAIKDVVPDIIKKVTNSEDKVDYKIASDIYYIVVVEFVVAILVEKDVVFKSFHKIVDGIIDADRLDYIMRDSLNSGVDWGKIPYKRLINSAKLVYLKTEDFGPLRDEDRPFVIAYPKKVTDDIEDLLLVRYKIFARINFHHRCMKTSVALQSAVKELAEDYLNSSVESDCVNADINLLWNALGLRAGYRNARVIQWNDSWLISVLHKSLVEITKSGRLAKTQTLRENLEEILLNKKRYYSLLKRADDNKVFVDRIFKYAKITKEKLERLEKKEYNKLYNNAVERDGIKELLDLPFCNAMDSIDRITILRKVMDTGQLEGLSRFLPASEKSINEIVEGVLKRFKEKRELADYKVTINKGKGKIGIPQHRDIFDEIYLCDGNDVVIFDDRVTLRKQMEAIEGRVLWLYVYFVPFSSYANISELAERLLDEMAQEIGKGLKCRYEELFGKDM